MDSQPATIKRLKSSKPFDNTLAESLIFMLKQIVRLVEPEGRFARESTLSAAGLSLVFCSKLSRIDSRHLRSFPSAVVDRKFIFSDSNRGEIDGFIPPFQGG